MNAEYSVLEPALLKTATGPAESRPSQALRPLSYWFVDWKPRSRDPVEAGMVRARRAGRDRIEQRWASVSERKIWTSSTRAAVRRRCGEPRPLLHWKGLLFIARASKLYRSRPRARPRGHGELLKLLRERAWSWDGGRFPTRRHGGVTIVGSEELPKWAEQQPT